MDLDYEDINYEDAQYEDYEPEEDYYDLQGEEEHQVSKEKVTFVTPNVLMKEIQKRVQNVANTCSLTYGWSLLLLKELKWNPDNIMDYFSKPSEFKTKIKYQEEENSKKIGPEEPCLGCESKQKLIRNACGHGYCYDCWINYLKIKMHDSPFMSCMSCEVPLLYQTVEKIICDDSHVQNSLKKLICINFARAQPSYQFCFNCEDFLQINDLKLQATQCRCGKLICLKCGYENHKPCSCQERQQWIEALGQGSSHEKWLTGNIKKCRFCSRGIKETRSNYVRCVCGKSFCFVCLSQCSPFQIHPYCFGWPANNNFDSFEKMDIMERYRKNDELKEKLQKADYFSEKKLFKESLNLNLQETSFIDEAKNLAIMCCEDLKWKYVSLYNKKYTNQAFKTEVEFYIKKYEEEKKELVHKLQEMLDLLPKKLQKKNCQKQKITNRFFEFKIGIQGGMNKLKEALEHFLEMGKP